MNSDQLPSATVSIIVLVMLIAGLLSSKRVSFSQAIKYSVLWLLFGLIIVILYSYRFEFTELKNRVAGSINPTKPRLDREKRQIVIKISDDGHYYLRAEINKKNILFMVDTGATSVAISGEDAKTIGFDVKKLNYNKKYQTANGISFGASVNLDAINIDGYVINNINASVNPNLSGASLFGMSALKKFSSYQFINDTLILYLP